MSALLLPAADTIAVGNPTLNIGIFLGFVVFTLCIVIKVAGGKNTAEQYYTSAGAFSGRQNGIAIAGDYLSAASFLGIAGAIAPVSYTHLRAHETVLDLVCRLLLEKQTDTQTMSSLI